MLTESGIVRSDLTPQLRLGVGGGRGRALTTRLTVLDTANGAGPLQGAAIYLWHCDPGGRFMTATLNVPV